MWTDFLFEGALTNLLALNQKALTEKRHLKEIQGLFLLGQLVWKCIIFSSKQETPCSNSYFFKSIPEGLLLKPDTYIAEDKYSEKRPYIIIIIIILDFPSSVGP